MATSSDRFGHRKRRVNARQEKEDIMCCNCNEEAPFNYSNGFQTYARPTSGPYIATTHIPSEYGPVYVD